MRKKRPHYDISASSLDLWERCPKAWRHRYLDRLGDAPGEALLIGSAAHDALETLSLAAQAGKVGRAHKDLALALAARDYGERPTTKATPLIDGVKPGGDLIEYWFTYRAGNGIIAGGYWDRVDLEDKVATITDYKSGKKRDAYFLERSAQTELYLAAGRQRWPDRKIVMRYRYLRSATAVEFAWQPIVTSRIEGRIQKAIGEQRRAGQDYPAESNALCRFCAWRFGCAVFQADTASKP